MDNVYGVAPGEVFWAASDFGWAVGHSYIVYAPLLHGCTTVIYEGKPVGTPDPGEFWRVIEEYEVAGPLHRAHGVSGHQAGRPAAASTCANTTSRSSAACSSPASGWTRTPTTGRAGSCRSR